ncbi:MAG: hypothetical protein ACAI18_17415 [Gemmatimonadales bacterium]
MPQHLRTIALAVLLGCGSTAPNITRNSDLDVLFIGNSLTATNDIPGLVSSLGQISGGPHVRVSEVSFGNFSLEDHWNQGDALEAIDRGAWDYVVMQQGPSTLPESRQNLIEWTGRFAERIRLAGARPAIYMVWPSNGDFDGVSRSYTDAAHAVNGMLIPAGEAFRSVSRDHPEITIFQSDNFHPTQIGSYLAALVIYGQLTDREVEGVTLRRPVTGLSQTEAGELEAAADQANRDHGVH